MHKITRVRSRWEHIAEDLRNTPRAFAKLIGGALFGGVALLILAGILAGGLFLLRAFVQFLMH